MYEYIPFFLLGCVKMARTVAKIKFTVKSEPNQKYLNKAKQAKLEEKRLRAEINTMIQRAKSQIKQLYRIYGTATPAIKALRERGTTLSVKGKNFHELQSTYFSLDKFLKAQTSNVQGAERVLQRTAEIIGTQKITPSNIKQLAREFFEIASKSQQILQSDAGFWGGSSRIFSAIREIQQQANANWENATTIEEKAGIVADKLTVKQQEEHQYNEMAEYAAKITVDAKGTMI